MRVHLDRSLMRLDGGRTLAGGAPFTILRLTRPVAVEDSGSPVGQRLVATGLGHPDPTDATPVDPAELTVVVPTRDRDVDVAALVPLRVVVVDDASAVPVAGAVRRETNGGPAAARNTGLWRVSTPYVAFVDSDLAVTAADLLALTRHFADPQVVAVGPRVRGRAPGVAHPAWWQRYDATHSPLDLGPRPAEVRPGGLVGYLPSACLVARTAALGAGFDEALRVGEDVDLVWRLRERGGRVRYDPSVVVRHDTRPSFGAWLRQVHGYGTSAAPLALRHGDAVAPAALTPVLGAVAIVVLARTRWSVPAAAVGAGVTGWRVRRALPPVAAARVATRALGWAVRQESSLAVRHWWPGVALAAVVSRRARRALVTALAVDTVVALADQREAAPGVLLAGRRAADLAYGAGVWRGAWAARSARCLLPRVPATRPSGRR
ncbi:mycofactocin biosynthesis glycosyltransferase MftF [Nocardioides sp. C4-1]|uniref:mycofactocin biosynthesis glycosyltransferase MftF n=1 Tax=Nocardioides sp. C4-1 TaxID=3151851 RepID=UPI0032668D30